MQTERCPPGNHRHCSAAFIDLDQGKVLGVASVAQKPDGFTVGAAATATADLLAGHIPAGDEGGLDQDVDADLFRQIVTAAVENQAAMDTIIAGKLASGWKLERIDSVARAILRAGVIELWRRKDVPTPVVISEYVDVAHAFYDKKESAFVNGLLDGIAKDVRG